MKLAIFWCRCQLSWDIKENMGKTNALLFFGLITCRRAGLLGGSWYSFDEAKCRYTYGSLMCIHHQIVKMCEKRQRVMPTKWLLVCWVWPFIGHLCRKWLYGHMKPCIWFRHATFADQRVVCSTLFNYSWRLAHAMQYVSTAFFR